MVNQKESLKMYYKLELLHNVEKENSKLDKDLSTDLGKHVRCLAGDKTF